MFISISPLKIFFFLKKHPFKIFKKNKCPPVDIVHFSPLRIAINRDIYSLIVLWSLPSSISFLLNFN